MREKDFTIRLENSDDRHNWRSILEQAMSEVEAGIAEELERTAREKNPNDWGAAFRTRLANFSMALDFYNNGDEMSSEIWSVIKERLDLLSEKAAGLHQKYGGKGKEVPRGIQNELIGEFKRLVPDDAESAPEGFGERRAV